MKIGIIGAIKQEIKIFKNLINYNKIKIFGNFKIYIGKFNKINIFLIQSGIGKVAASIATMILITLFKPNMIINSGSAGSLNSKLKIGDIIIPNQLCYHDVNLTNFGYSIGQIPKYPKKFQINKKLFNKIIEIFKKNKLKILTGLIITGDSFINKRELINKLKIKFSSAIGVEMEAAAIAQVCYKFNIPLIIIKSISDLSNNQATINFKKNISIASLKSSNLVILILKKIKYLINLLNK
ncbi:5'-methylthioadenosine/S-adenosylhomocysteine nucleosidase [Buchnera aphidicola (Protaphis terricola)]|uniref:5'-methylthioadenosine/adenosylhomocysteine nucleosidase n=1 Tax=Buchnera aphidicola TaxID=9 RepID=UPI0034639F0F